MNESHKNDNAGWMGGDGGRRHDLHSADECAMKINFMWIFFCNLDNPQKKHIKKITFQFVPN